MEDWVAGGFSTREEDGRTFLNGYLKVDPTMVEAIWERKLWMKS